MKLNAASRLQAAAVSKADLELVTGVLKVLNTAPKGTNLNAHLFSRPPRWVKTQMGGEPVASLGIDNQGSGGLTPELLEAALDHLTKGLKTLGFKVAVLKSAGKRVGVAATHPTLVTFRAYRANDSAAGGAYWSYSYTRPVTTK